MIRTRVSHWFVGGAVAAAAGFSPEHWFESLFHVAHAPEQALHLWSLGVDMRWVFLGLGSLVMVADVLGHLRPHGAHHAVPAHPMPSQQNTISVAPQTTIAPVNTFAPSFTVHISGDGKIVQSGDAHIAVPSRTTPDKPIILPYPSLGTLFKGRDAFLKRLRDSLTRPDGGKAAIAGRAVHGLGGPWNTPGRTATTTVPSLCSTPRRRFGCKPASPP